jgi:hypothetical protein
LLISVLLPCMLSIPGTYQLCFHPRAFATAVYSVWNPFPQIFSHIIPHVDEFST